MRAAAAAADDADDEATSARYNGKRQLIVDDIHHGLLIQPFQSYIETKHTHTHTRTHTHTSVSLYIHIQGVLEKNCI